jgi:hypothetical protein
MITLIIFFISGIIILSSLICLFWWLSEKFNYSFEDFFTTVSIIFSIILIIFVVIACIVIPLYYSAIKEAGYLNKKYELNITADDLFWHGDTIKKELRDEIDFKDSNNKIELKIK